MCQTFEISLDIPDVTIKHMTTNRLGHIEITVKSTVAQGELQHRVSACLSDLPKREAHLLQLRLGLNTDHSHSLKEIGDIYGLSRERIRQLETLALKKLRTSKSGAILSDFY